MPDGREALVLIRAKLANGPMVGSIQRKRRLVLYMHHGRAFVNNLVVRKQLVISTQDVHERLALSGLAYNQVAVLLSLVEASDVEAIRPLNEVVGQRLPVLGVVP